MDQNKLLETVKELRIPDHLTCLLINLYAGQEAIVRTRHEMEKEYVKAVYCHLAYLTYMQSTSCEMPGWMKQKLESRLPGEIPITSDKHITPPYGRKRRGTEEPLEESERGE